MFQTLHSRNTMNKVDMAFACLKLIIPKGNGRSTVHEHTDKSDHGVLKERRYLH